MRSALCIAIGLAVVVSCASASLAQGSGVLDQGKSAGTATEVKEALTSATSRAEVRRFGSRAPVRLTLQRQTEWRGGCQSGWKSTHTADVRLPPEADITASP